MAQLNRHFWAANVTVRGATRRNTERVESVRGGKCAKCRLGENVCLCRCQGFICGCCGTLQVACCEFYAGQQTLDVEFVVLAPAAVVPEFQRCHRGAKRCCIAAVANVTPDSGQNCAGHCWLTTNTNTMLHTVAGTHTNTESKACSSRQSLNI